MLKILILEGGFNEEHEVSINTASEVKKSLKNLNIEFDSIMVNPKNFVKIIDKYSKDYLCFNALHGTFGEDGSLQKILDENFIKYTHSDAISSNIAFNKYLAKEKIKNTKILTADSIILDTKEINELKILEIINKFEFFVIKPVASGSSFAVRIFNNYKDIMNLKNNLYDYLKIYKNHNTLLIEKYIPGRDLTVSVIDNNNKSEAIEVTEIIPKNSFYDYKSKYTKGFFKHILPATLPKTMYETCLQYAKIAHDTIGCKGISRSDFLYYNNKIYFLEINSQPGLTPISLLPEQLKYKKINFDQLIMNIINLSL